MKISRISNLTGEYHTREINITIDQYIDWQNASENDDNRFVQNAFKHLSANDREFLISGITPEEWDNAFGDDEDEDIDYIIENAENHLFENYENITGRDS